MYTEYNIRSGITLRVKRSERMLDDDLFNAECDILLIVDSLERQVLTVLTLSVNKILFY